MGGNVWLRLFLAAPAVVLAPTAARAAQEDPNAATKAETERLKAETDKINAQADRERARITSLGLPSYTGDTELKDKAGEMEAMLLSAPAVRLAGARIAQVVDPGKAVLLLVRDDPIDFGVVGAMEAEIGGLLQQLVGVDGQSGTRDFVGAPTAIAALSALGGLLRSETTVAPATVTVSDTMLLAAVATTLKDRARLPSAAIAPLKPAQAPLLAKFDALIAAATKARQMRETLAGENGGKPDEATKRRIPDLDATLKRYDSFYARVTTADANGAVPIARAARLQALQNEVSGVLRVHVEKSGGSLINSKNITTFFGADPVRVSGGLVASYVLSEPNGAVQSAGIVACRTDLARLRAIQEGTVKYRLPGNPTRGSAGDSDRAQCLPEPARP